MRENQPLGVIGQPSNHVWCRFAGPGRGDCKHFLGLPVKLDETTTDEYGIPHGWCEYCWSSHQRDDLQHQLAESRERLAEALDHLRWLIPMAKGYAQTNPVGSNLAMVNNAESFTLDTEPPALLKEVERLKDNIEHLATSRGKWMSRAESAEKEVERLRAELKEGVDLMQSLIQNQGPLECKLRVATEALKNYGNHTPVCRHLPGGDQGDCDCGWTDIMAKLTDGKETT
jgi:hypothetical protein